MRNLQETTFIELFLSNTIIDDTALMYQQQDINSNYFIEHVTDDTAKMYQQQDINSNYFIEHVTDDTAKMYQRQDSNSNCFIKHVIDDTAQMYQQQDIDWNSFLTTQSVAHWNRSEDKLFEEALVMFPEDSPDRWQKIANKLQGKSPTDVREHYEALVHDVLEIDSGRVELPSYTDDLDWDSQNQISFEPILKHSEPERKKGTPWTEEEHKLFLIGLCKFGKGDWRSISRNVVLTRTPTQVASHAQKYFLRQINSGKRERKRSSIHDITTVDNNNVAVPVDENWIPSPGAAGHQQPSALQQFPPPSQVPGQGGLFGYQNYGFPM